ncbi:hypothetical protein A6R68_05958, partial [Neotoma lepida]
MGPWWDLGLVLTVWLSGFMVERLFVAMMAQLRFCGSKQVEHFYCDFSPLMVLACSDIGLLAKVVAVLYTVVTPIFNPDIYTLRNQEVHQALKRLLYCKATE